MNSNQQYSFLSIACGLLFLCWSYLQPGTQLQSEPQESGSKKTKSYLQVTSPITTNGSTLTYSVDLPGNVTIKIYNLLGSEIITLVSEQQDAGTHQVTWQPQNVASGCYICSLETPNGVSYKKIILLY